MALGASSDSWDNGSPYAPSVHRLPNGSYCMFYQAMQRTAGQPPAQDCRSGGNATANATQAHTCDLPLLVIARPFLTDCSWLQRRHRGWSPHRHCNRLHTRWGKQSKATRQLLVIYRPYLTDCLRLQPWLRTRAPLFYDSVSLGPSTTSCVDEQDATALIKADGSVLIMYLSSWNL